MNDFSGYFVGRRVALIKISPQIMLDICTSGRLGNGNDIIVDGIPPGSTMVEKGYHYMDDIFWLIVEHESFDPVGEDGNPPIAAITMQVNYLPRFDVLRG